MVGGFSNVPTFDQLTHRLELKLEYLGVGEIISMAGQLLVTFNTETTEKELYPYFFVNGLDYLFDIVEIVI
jgi:hypothetical protein